MIFVSKEDREILYTDEVYEMRKRYREKFGEPFICFHYSDFPGTDTQLPAEMYKEALRKALLDNKPSALKHKPDALEKERSRESVVYALEDGVADHTKVFMFKYNGRKGRVITHSENDFELQFDGKCKIAHSINEVMGEPFFNGKPLNEIAYELTYDKEDTWWL